MADETTTTPETPPTDGGFVVPEDAAPVIDPAVVEMAKKGKASCPVCGKKLDVYTGDNPLKFGTGFCVVHGRQPLGVQ